MIEKEYKKINIFKKKIFSAINITKVTVNHFLVDKSFLAASGMVYTTLTALIPAFTVIFTFFGALGVLEPFRKLLAENINDIMNTNIGNEAIAFLNTYTTNATSLGIVGLVSFIVTLILLINRIWTTINEIYRTSSDRNIIKRFANFITFAIMSILLIAAFINFQSQLSEKYAKLMGITLTKGFFGYLKHLVPFFIVWLSIFLLIEFVPNTKVEFSAAGIGSFVGSIIITIINYIFFNISDYFINLSVIYGSFAFIFLFLIMMYMMWLIIYFSVELAFVYQFRPDLEKNNGMQHSPAIFLSEGVNIVMLIGSNYKGGKGATTTREMNVRLAIPDKWLYGYLDFLETEGFIIATNNGKTCFIPARPLDQLKVKDLVHGLYGLDSISFDDKDTAGEAVSIQIHGHGVNSLGSLTIENLLERI